MIFVLKKSFFIKRLFEGKLQLEVMPFGRFMPETCAAPFPLGHEIRSRCELEGIQVLVHFTIPFADIFYLFSEAASEWQFSSRLDTSFTSTNISPSSQLHVRSQQRLWKTPGSCRKTGRKDVAASRQPAVTLQRLLSWCVVMCQRLPSPQYLQLSWKDFKV